MVFSEKEGSFSGCCINVVILSPSNIYVGNLGDCRALLVSGNDSKSLNLLQLSRDHKAYIEKSRISSLGGFIENDRLNGLLAISRSLGDRDYKVMTMHQDKKFAYDLTDFDKNSESLLQIFIKNKSFYKNDVEWVKMKFAEYKLGSSSPSINVSEHQTNQSKSITKPRTLSLPLKPFSIWDYDILNHTFDCTNKKPSKKPPSPKREYDTLLSAIPEITIKSRDESDFMIIIGSDGLYDYFSNNKIEKFLKKKFKSIKPDKKTLKKLCKDLCEESYYRGSEDDITTVLLLLRDVNSSKEDS